MAEEQEDENKRIRPRERARGQKRSNVIQRAFNNYVGGQEELGKT